MAGRSMRLRLKLVWGTVRRFYLHTLNRSYIRRQRSRIRGECRRCGACCRLTMMTKCPFFDESGELPGCIEYCNPKRYTNCRVFPIDELDLAHRNMVSVPDDGPCGYYFDPPRVWHRPRRSGP